MRTVKILGTYINVKKPIKVGLMQIYGIGESRANEIIKELKWTGNEKLGELTHKQNAKLIKKLEEKKRNKEPWILEYELKKQIEQDISKQLWMGSYVGIRHKLNLPVRGQRTRSNGRTQQRLMRARWIRY